MRQFIVLAAAFVFGFSHAVLCAIAGGDEVVVIYNSNVPESKSIAEYYAKRREVPQNHVWGFPLSTDDIVSRADFRNSLQQPLLRKLESSNLWTFGTALVRSTNGQPVKLENTLLDSKIRYAVLCYGVPLRIAPDPSLDATAPASLKPELRRNDAAVDSELAWLPLVYHHPPLTGPLNNVFHTATNANVFHPTNGILMVARLDGPTPQIARGLVDKALEAETNGLWGRAYFDLRKSGDANYKLGDEWILGAAEVCRVLGFETIVEDSPETFPKSFPMSQIAFYCGWYDIDVSGPFTLPEVEFVPGAFAYHLHSYSANTLRSTNKWWVGPLLARGATITMGCVQEPYLSGTPDVSAFAGRLIYFKFTFGEAAYAAQPVLSWQTTVVGDPLYRPFGKDSLLLHKELEAKQSPLLEWAYLRVVNLILVKKMPVAQAIGYLEQIEATRHSAVLSEKLGDLCAALGKPSSAIRAYEQALELDPSRQQRVRLRLTLGEKLEAANQDQQAYENYEKLLREWPDHPAVLDVHKRLLSLAKKLEKPDDVTKWVKLIKTSIAAQTNSPTPVIP